MAFSRRAMCDRSRSATQNTSTIFKILNKTCIQFYRWESRIDGESGNAKKWPCGNTGFQVSIGGTMRYQICSWDNGPKTFCSWDNRPRMQIFRKTEHTTIVGVAPINAIKLRNSWKVKSHRGAKIVAKSSFLVILGTLRKPLGFEGESGQSLLVWME